MASRFAIYGFAGNGSQSRRLQLKQPHLVNHQAGAPGDGTYLRLKLDNHLGVQYSAPITVGGQVLPAVYDTGSFEIMVMSSRCESCNVSLARYDSDASSTYEKSDRPVGSHNFVGGAMLARQDFETVHVGNPSSPLVATEMAFWQVLDTNMGVWTHDRAQFTAIVGMGHGAEVPKAEAAEAIPDDASVSLLDRVHGKRFAYCLERGPSNPGWLTVNPDVDESLFRTVPVIGVNHWAVQLDDVHLTDDNKNVVTQESVAIVDSGTSMLGVPPEALKAMWGVISAIEHDCSNLDKLPDLVFKLGGISFTMPPAAYVIQFAHDTTAPTACIPAFMDLEYPSDLGQVWVLGMPFLRHFHTIFDREGPSLLIAEQGADCAPASEGSTAGSAAFLHPRGLEVTPRSGLTFADPRMARRPSWAPRDREQLKV